MGAMTGEVVGRREEKRRQTHRRIYDEAVRLFREKGFDAVAVGDIAKAAGVSVPTFYAHYDSKEAILISLPTREELQAVFAAQPEGLSAAERARGAIFLWLDQIEAHAREDVLERWRIITATPSLRLRTAASERATAALALAALQAEDGHRPTPAVEVAVTALMSAYTQIVLRWADDDGARPLRVVADEVMGELRDQM
jgi:AcrR family transcriptional regulator